ncbi:RND family efflux transporter, MFP subunit [Noviherbaspirillum humi]|uniref:RND family efflux transporter, MFP subunit n=1 Tax=Noviherbaspirillum humi TaxID=1688639 RepID=A0A239FZM9_9BURK|nr:efflux RND transporter periplasmic adaptor subunit [Noviherbaspirillum humi]SNS62626.1 RND family efflux transporter, MFP subunit [Noviherbaspirillum humi]
MSSRKSLRRPALDRFPFIRTAMPVLAACLLLACSKPVEKTEDVRPVRVMKIAAGSVDASSEFAGEVRARIESRLGFRVGGKIVSRKIDVGATVKRGQVLMELDPQDLRLAQTQAQAALKAAQTNRDLAKSELERYRDLRAKNFVSQAVLESKEGAYQAAQASYDQAVAALRNQANQVGYATLVSDADGVVTAIDAEVGQVVSAGTPVVRVAQLSEKEVVIGLPEDKVDALRGVTDVRIRTWANAEQVFPGKVREVSPVADPASRTYTAKISIPNAPAEVKLGMTAYVGFVQKAAGNVIRLPLAALVRDKEANAVWLVENGAVRQAPVKVAGLDGNDVLVAGGLAPGQTVVTAGVNLLKPGQKVKLLDPKADPADRSDAGAAK